MQPQNLLLAYELMISKLTLSNDDIKALFGTKCASTISDIKRPVLMEMAKKGIYFTRGKVHLDTAYEVWGLNERDLERRYAKAQRYSISGTKGAKQDE